VAKDPKNEGAVFTFAAFTTSSDAKENCTAQYGVAMRCDKAMSSLKATVQTSN
jgi:hypothetical protein